MEVSLIGVGDSKVVRVFDWPGLGHLDLVSEGQECLELVAVVVYLVESELGNEWVALESIELSSLVVIDLTEESHIALAAIIGKSRSKPLGKVIPLHENELACLLVSINKLEGLQLLGVVFDLVANIIFINVDISSVLDGLCSTSLKDKIQSGKDTSSTHIQESEL